MPDWYVVVGIFGVAVLGFGLRVGYLLRLRGVLRRWAAERGWRLVSFQPMGKRSSWRASDTWRRLELLVEDEAGQQRRVAVRCGGLRCRVQEIDRPSG
jgi:hypothetical protein